MNPSLVPLETDSRMSATGTDLSRKGLCMQRPNTILSQQLPRENWVACPSRNQVFFLACSFTQLTGLSLLVYAFTLYLTLTRSLPSPEPLVATLGSQDDIRSHYADNRGPWWSVSWLHALLHYCQISPLEWGSPNHYIMYFSHWTIWNLWKD